MTQTVPANSSGLQTVIDKAIADLAQRLAVSTDEIDLLEARSVTWPDASLGCPQKDMVYAQVLTPGYLIMLEHDGNTYEYHASTGNTVITCVNPSRPVPGTPGNT